MVNVGGRSKGCSTCRRRRVKCDETRPICLRCQRQNLDCDGPRDLTFIESNFALSRRTKKDASKSPAQSPGPPIAGPSNLPPPSSPPSTALVTLPTPSLPLIGDPLEYYILFARTHLAPDGPMDLAFQEIQLTNYTPSQSLSHPPSTSTSTPPTDFKTAHLETVLSFATIFFATHHSNPQALALGLNNHGATLRRLQTALSHPDCWKHDELIVAVTTLAVQETLIPTGPGNYMNHMLGLDRLLALRDPRVFNSKRSVELYKCLRHLIVFAALIAGRRSVLAREDWKSVLRDSCETEEERMEDEVYGVLADCSGVVVDVGELEKEGDGGIRDEKRRELRDKTVAMGRQLERWRQAWDADGKNGHMEIFPIVEVQDENPGSPRTTSTLYSDMVFANPISPLILLLYNTARLYVCKILFSLGPNQEQQKAIKAAQRTALLELCRGVPDHSSGSIDTQLHAGPVVHWAVQMASVLLGEDESDEGKAMKDTLMRKCGWIVEFGIKMHQ